MIDQGLGDRPNHEQGADHTHLEYAVQACSQGTYPITRSLTIQLVYSSYRWASVPLYGEPLQQKKGTRPKNYGDLGRNTFFLFHNPIPLH